MPTRSSAPSAPIRKLTEKIRHNILEGIYSPDMAFPSLRDLSREHGVSMRVVQGAMAILETEGLIYRRERRGTFVRGTSLPKPDLENMTSPLRCINFVERPSGTVPDFVRSSYMLGYTEALEHLNIKMRVVNCPSRGENTNDIAMTFFSPLFPFQEQGCVLINLVSPQLIEWLNARQIPFVIQSNTCYERENLPPHHAVMVNKFAGAMVAVRHLVALGHDRIGYVGRREVGDGDLTPLYRGYEAAMCEAGLGVRDQDVLEFVNVEPAHAREPLLIYLSRSSRPTAVITETDMSAFSVIETARSMGLDVPGDLSVVGYNDQEEAAAFTPPLTTVSNYRVMLARRSVELLFEVVAGQHPTPRHQILQPRLIERSTTTKPPRKIIPGSVPSTISTAWQERNQT